jgi:hypothetical protein
MEGMAMNRLSTFLLAAAVALGFAAHAQTAGKPAAGSDRARLIGAWHLVSLGEVSPDGTMNAVAGLKGSLIYTADGHMSVQVVYPNLSVNNDYALHGYEASFGSYDVDESAHTVTHHVQGSITPALVGKSLTRAYRLQGRQLTIHSTRPDEHWQVTWEHE